MTFMEYANTVLPSWTRGRQTKTRQTQLHAGFGLIGETGELFEKYKRRDFRGETLYTDDELVLEYGDVFCYLIFVLYEYGLDIQEIKPQEVDVFQLEATSEFHDWSCTESLIWYFQSLSKLPWGFISLGLDTDTSAIRDTCHRLLKPLSRSLYAEGYLLSDTLRANEAKILSRMSTRPPFRYDKKEA